MSMMIPDISTKGIDRTVTVTITRTDTMKVIADIDPDRARDVEATKMTEGITHCTADRNTTMRTMALDMVNLSSLNGLLSTISKEIDSTPSARIQSSTNSR